MIQITGSIAVPDREVRQRFVRAAGDRGQNLRHTATAVELRFDIQKSSLPIDVRERLVRLAGRHVTNAGVLIIVSRASRSQKTNQASARARLVELLKRAAGPPTAHARPETPAAAREDRLAAKHRRTTVKRDRQPVRDARRSV